MTAPQTGPTVVDLEEIGIEVAAATNPPALPKAADVKLGDDVPEEFRGKSAADLVDYTNKLKDALRISEASRSQPAQAPAARTEPAPTPEPEITPEQLREMFDQDPVKAVQAMQEQWAKKAESHFSARMQPLVTGAAQAAESVARTKYAEEFALYENEIKEIVSGMNANAKSALSDPRAWDDLIGYVRGKSGNFEKLVQSRINKEMEGMRRQTAQHEQVASTGMQFTQTNRAPASRDMGGAPDATIAHICEVMGISYAEYKKWIV